MNTQKLLLIIGILGITASIIGIIKGQEFTTHIIGFVCGASLIYGYFELKKDKDEQAKIN